MKFKNKNNISPVIEVRNVTKIYILKHEKPTLIENILYRSNNDIHEALKDISFSVNKGERIGIIGSNGSGKTTLLKLLAGITKQHNGQITIRGRIVSLIDLSAGFHPDLTGEENIFLNGLIIGMTREELNEKKNEIIKFADIGKFIDAPLYTYSSGMNLRLGFSIAVHSNPDILLLDEGFGVGDDNFRDKANKKILQFKNEKKTIIMVSHWLKELERNCQKFLWIEKGKLKVFGGKEVLKMYDKDYIFL